MPKLRDSNFRRSVELICDHGEEGSFGLILIRPRSTRPSDLTGGLLGDGPLSLSGSVRTHTLPYVHVLGSALGESEQLPGRVHWGDHFERSCALFAVDAPSPSSLCFFVDYAGWTAEQLDYEIRSGGWLVAQGLHDVTFVLQPSTLWRTALMKMGGPYILLAIYLDDLRAN